ncbi:hypothetical protein ANN_24869 [Periplaneta americana]|uniref:Uncharacterized protein n=1 Tax=Periplaneta americana TaxID=6978 RepID=A0ABQ8S0F7_PERAM|nr:hypothetical protein ANN_24869 [Periplaneta americana]
MSPGSSTESYPAFARIGLRENPGKNLNQRRFVDIALFNVKISTRRQSNKTTITAKYYLCGVILRDFSVFQAVMISVTNPAVRSSISGSNVKIHIPLQITTCMSRAVASLSKASCLGLALRNVRWFESSWGKKFSHEISASVWDRCPPSIVMHLGSYDRFEDLGKDISLKYSASSYDERVVERRNNIYDMRKSLRDLRRRLIRRIPAN